jgi:hypothetical protein
MFAPKGAQSPVRERVFAGGAYKSEPRPLLLFQADPTHFQIGVVDELQDRERVPVESCAAPG